MPNKTTINDIPNRISANFFALIGFANFAILLSYIGKDFDYNIFVELILMYGFCIYLFGVISIASIPFGYLAFAGVIIGLPIICICNRISNEKEEEAE